MAKRKPGSPPELPDFPEYHRLGLQQRLAYLGWLADGKRDASYPAGYAFLYFCGLERRLLVDSPGPDEEDRLVAEVQRLLAMQRGSGRLEFHAVRLLELVELRRLSTGPDGLRGWKSDLGAIRRGGVSERPPSACAGPG